MEQPAAPAHAGASFIHVGRVRTWRVALPMFWQLLVFTLLQILRVVASLAQALHRLIDMTVRAVARRR